MVVIHTTKCYYATTRVSSKYKVSFCTSTTSNPKRQTGYPNRKPCNYINGHIILIPSNPKREKMVPTYLIMLTLAQHRRRTILLARKPVRCKSSFTLLTSRVKAWSLVQSHNHPPLIKTYLFSTRQVVLGAHESLFSKENICFFRSISQDQWVDRVDSPLEVLPHPQDAGASWKGEF